MKFVMMMLALCGATAAFGDTYFYPQPDYSACKSQSEIALVNKSCRMHFDRFCGIPIATPITNEVFKAKNRKLGYGAFEVYQFQMKSPFRYFDTVGDFMVNRYRKPNCWCWENKTNTDCELKVFAVYLTAEFRDNQGYTEAWVLDELERTTLALEKAFDILFTRVYSRKECTAEFYNGFIKVGMLRDSGEKKFILRLSFMQDKDMVLPHAKHFESKSTIGGGADVLLQQSSEFGF